MHRQLEDIFHHFSVVRNGETIIPHGRIKWLYEQAKKTVELESKINAYNETIRNLDVLADSVNYASIEHKPTTEYIADEINRNISELEKKVGEIR